MFLQTTGMEELHSLLRETENIESHLRLLCEEGETAMEAIEPSELTRSLERKDAAVRTAISEGARIDCEVYEERHLRRLQWSKALHLEYILVSFLKPGTIEDNGQSGRSSEKLSSYSLGNKLGKSDNFQNLENRRGKNRWEE